MKAEIKFGTGKKTLLSPLIIFVQSLISACCCKTAEGHLKFIFSRIRLRSHHKATVDQIWLFCTHVTQIWFFHIVFSLIWCGPLSYVVLDLIRVWSLAVWPLWQRSYWNSWVSFPMCRDSLVMRLQQILDCSPGHPKVWKNCSSVKPSIKWPFGHTHTSFSTELPATAANRASGRKPICTTAYYPKNKCPYLSKMILLRKYATHSPRQQHMANNYAERCHWTLITQDAF